MKYSQLLGKTRKNISADAVSINHQLLLRGGYVDQLAAGIFTWLPLGLRVLNKINNIVRNEMNNIGGQEVTMPALIPKNNWLKTGRWENVDILFKIKSQTDKEYGLGFSHEEVVTPLAKQYINSYKDLPLSIYQIQTKFRDELRAKSGMLRGREFGMKDMYSFHTSIEDLHSYYEAVISAYLKIFSRMGLTEIKITEASGGSFTKKHSHEFNVLTPAGELELSYCDECTFAQNTELGSIAEGDKCPGCHKGKIKIGKAIEVGNIFDLGEKFAKDFSIEFTDEKGERKLVQMGCYGIGVTRLVGTIVEMCHDEKGILWPETVAPFQAHLISLPGVEAKVQEVYEKLMKSGVEVLWDEREVGAGNKFADADLIGIPWRLVVSAKTGDQIEVKKRSEEKIELLSVDQCLKRLS